MQSLLVLAYLLLAIVSLVCFLWRRHLSYWADRGIVYEKPGLLFGNLREVGRTQALRDPFHNFYAKYKHTAPFGGFFLSMRKAIVLFDLELVKNVLIKDFTNFAHRGRYYNEQDDPVSAHLFNLDGPSWRVMRSKLTPTFTSGKMKFMFSTVTEVADRFVHVIEQLIAQAETSGGKACVEVKELLARYTTDVIGSCAFGLECNSLKDPNTKFRIMGRKIFEQNRHGKLIFGLAQGFPNFARKLHIKLTPEDVCEFFQKVVRDTVHYRERENVHRNDFMNILMELKNQPDGLSIDQITAQAFVFFLAGFETSSSTMGFALYELAVNPHIQERARTEINEVLARHEGKFTYEAMRELKYLHQIFCETLRKYSIASITLRKTVNDYQVPNTKHVIEKGIVVIIPIDAIHRDPEIYPDPEVFDPERFTPEEVKKRHPMAWLPFGEGPRNCIGLRFGEMQAIVGLALLLKNFKFSLTKRMKVPLEMKLSSFILTSKEGIELHVEKVR